MWGVEGWKGVLMGVAWLGNLVGHRGVGLSSVFAVFWREEGGGERGLCVFRGFTFLVI